MEPTVRPVSRTYVDANRLWVDSRLRAVAQRRLEAPILRRLGGPVPGGEVLEIGCGRRGTGLRLAMDVFGAARADGVDLHPASVEKCRRATADLGAAVRVEHADATRLPAADATYDAVFDYHLLHHAEAWRDAVGEAARVLRPGGRLYACEMTARFIDSRLLRAIAYHPADGDRPTPQTLAAACADAGLRVIGQDVRVAGLWTSLVAAKA